MSRSPTLGWPGCSTSTRPSTTPMAARWGWGTQGRRAGDGQTPPPRPAHPSACPAAGAHQVDGAGVHPPPALHAPERCLELRYVGAAQPRARGWWAGGPQGAAHPRPRRRHRLGADDVRGEALRRDPRPGDPRPPGEGREAAAAAHLHHRRLHDHGEMYGGAGGGGDTAWVAAVAPRSRP